MPDNRDLASLTGNCAADEVTFSGDTTVVQLIRPVHVSGTEGSKTLTDLTGAAGSGPSAAMTVQGHASGTPVPVSGTVTANRTKAATATLTNVGASITSVTLKASNANRLGLVIMNESTSKLFIKFGATASATSYTYQLMSGELLREELYTGVVDGIWESAVGNARVTELT